MSLENEHELDNEPQEDLEEASEELDLEEGDESQVEEDEVEDGDSTVDEEESDDSESEFYESEEEYLKGKGIEGKDLDAVLDEYAKIKGEFTEKSSKIEQINALLKAQGFDDGIESLLSGKPVKQPEPTEKPTIPKTDGEYFSQSPFSDTFKELEDSIQDEGTKKFYKQFNSFADKAIAPQFKKIEEMYSLIVQNVLSDQKVLQDLRWATLDHPGKGLIKREQFEEAMTKYGIDDPDKIMNLLAIGNPDLLKALTSKAEERGVKKGKKLRKFKKGMSRGKADVKGTGTNWRKYYNPDGSLNNQKLETLSLDDQIKVLDAAEKATAPTK